MTEPLASLEEFANYRGVNVDYTDASAEFALETASSLVIRHTGRTFALETDELLALNGTGTNAMLLPDPPVAEVSLVEEIEHDADATRTTLETTDYIVDTTTGILYRLGGWWCRGIANVGVTYTHGFAEIPLDLRLAVMQIAGRLYAGAASSGTLSSGQSVESRTLGSFSETYSTATTTSVRLTAEEALSLDYWKLPRVF